MAVIYFYLYTIAKLFVWVLQLKRSKLRGSNEGGLPEQKP